MFETLLGLFFMVLALLPKTKFYPERLGTKQALPPIEPSWIMRLFFVGIGLTLFLDGVRQIRH
jgi:hypothetical protein